MTRKSGNLVAIVTGSTKGIGLATARALIEQGDRVIVSGRTPRDVESVAADLTASGPGVAHGIVCDVRDPVACSSLIQGAVDRFGGIDLLVNNAGVGRFAPIHEITPEDWELQLRTNLDGVFHCSRHAIPHLIAGGGGWIMNVGSLAGKNPFAGGAAYNATKFGLLGMSEAMMLDLRHHGIRVTCIMPGSVNTYFSGAPDPAMEWKLAPEDVARIVVDLLDFPERALPSRIEIRPSRPPKG